ncbi:MAG TPA: hypothetical protein VGJ00_00865 [Rhabdochlamydiaceae bacterium]
MKFGSQSQLFFIEKIAIKKDNPHQRTDFNRSTTFCFIICKS